MADVHTIPAASAEMQRRFAALRVRTPPTVVVPRLLGPIESRSRIVVRAFVVQQQFRQQVLDAPLTGNEAPALAH